jgi:integrase
MATIRKRGNRFHVQVRRKGFPSQTKSFLELADARKWARLKETEADRLEFPIDRKALSAITLLALVERYRDEIVPSKKGAEIETIILNVFLRHSICKKTLADLSAADFASYRDERLKVLTPKSLKRQLSPIHNMFRIAMEEWEVPLRSNPLTGLKLKGIDNKRERRLREGEFDRLIEAGKKNRNRYIIPAIRFALETAMRRGEILSLRWRDVDLSKATATLLETKNGYSRVIPLTATAIAILRSTCPEKRDDDARIFPIAANALRLSWERLTKRAEIDGLHFHDLRHEAISRLFEIGLTIPEVASISGHRDMRMLLRYAHAKNASIRAKLAKLDGLAL